LSEPEVVGIKWDLVRISRNLPVYDQNQLEFTGIKPEMAGVGLNQSVVNQKVVTGSEW